jgi:hypothetical protein
LGVDIPAGGHDARRNKLGADVAFAERFLIHVAPKSASDHLV